MHQPARPWIVASSVALLLAAVVVVPAAIEPKNDFHFSILGDRTGSAQPEIYGRVWREVDLLHPDFVINVGDSIEGGNDATAEQEWRALHALLQKYAQYPLYFTPGNHDVFSEASRKIYERETGHPTSYGFNYQDAHFTILDTSRDEELTDAQLKFLQSDLEANKTKSPKLIFFHKPFWLLFARVRNRDFPLHQLAKKYGVTYVISGHGHQFVRLVNDGVVYMEVGSSGASVTRGTKRGQGFKEGWFYHHVWASVKGSKIDLTVKEIDGKGQGRMFKAGDWTETGPTFDVEDPASSEKPGT